MLDFDFKVASVEVVEAERMLAEMIRSFLVVFASVGTGAGSCC